MIVCFVGCAAKIEPKTMVKVASPDNATVTVKIATLDNATNTLRVATVETKELNKQLAKIIINNSGIGSREILAVALGVLVIALGLAILVYIGGHAWTQRKEAEVKAKNFAAE